MQLAWHFRRATGLALVLVATLPSFALAQHHHAGVIHTADSGLNLRISALVDASSTLRTLVDQAGRAGLRIHVMPEGALPDDASAVLTIVGVNSGPTDVVVRLDVSAADARLAETLEHEIGHALAGTARSASGSEAPIAEGLSQLGLLAVRP